MEINLFLTLFLVFLNGFFVAAEFAIVKVRSSQIEIQVKAGHRLSKVAKYITQHLDNYLAATQLGITMASLGLGWVGEGVMTKAIVYVFALVNVDMTSGAGLTVGHILAFSSITILHIVFGELAPKSIAIKRPIGITTAVSLPLQVFYHVFLPVIWVLNKLANWILRLIGISPIDRYEAHHSSEELQLLLDQGKESGALDTTEHELIKNVFDFNERVVKNIMVPRTKIASISLDTPHNVILDTIIKEGYSRIPVYDETIDKIVGIMHTKDILPLLVEGKELVLKDIIRKPYFVPETKKINDLLSELQQKRIQIAIILDEFGGTAGMVTLEDIVEEIVGEIQDEYDEEKPIVEKVSENEFVVNAEASIYDINEYLPHDLPEDRNYDTLSGLVSDLFGKIPEVGEQKDFYGYTFTILKKTDQNIESVNLQLLVPKDNVVNLH